MTGASEHRALRYWLETHNDLYPGEAGGTSAEEPECFEGSLNDAGSPAAPFPAFLQSQLDRRADATREKHGR